MNAVVNPSGVSAQIAAEALAAALSRCYDLAQPEDRIKADNTSPLSGGPFHWRGVRIRLKDGAEVVITAESSELLPDGELDPAAVGEVDVMAEPRSDFNGPLPVDLRLEELPFRIGWAAINSSGSGRAPVIAVTDDGRLIDISDDAQQIPASPATVSQRREEIISTMQRVASTKPWVSMPRVAEFRQH